MQREQPDERPPGGLTLLAVPTGSSRVDLLERVRQAWAVVAAWGRWCDGELGDWIEITEALAALPDWLRAAWQHGLGFETRLDDLHDREWIWWSGAVVGDRVKVDVLVESLPITLWPLRAVIEKAGVGLSAKTCGQLLTSWRTVEVPGVIDHRIRRSGKRHSRTVVLS